MDWRIAKKADLAIIIDFLLKNENRNIQALSLFLYKKRFYYPTESSVISLIAGYNSRIDSMIIISSKGLIYPIFSLERLNSSKDKASILKLFSTVNVNVHGVVGFKEDVDFFDSIIFKPLRKTINYSYMVRESEIPLPNDKGNIKKAKNRDFNRLIPLEYEYQKEEVIVEESDFNKRAISLNFRFKLSKKDIYYIIENGLIVSKGGISYNSLNYVLIGGIFTWKRVRNHGLSTKLLSYLINDQLSKGYKSALFVKDTNFPAIHLYKKLGFSNPVPYQINYYKR